MTKKSLVLLILDGWGHHTKTEHNAIALAHTPIWDTLWTEAPHTLLSGSGLEVGLPEGQMGNSEVGHMTIGAGRVIDQDLTRISKAIDNQTFYKNSILESGFKHACEQHSAIHLMGLFSPGGIHSHEDHFFATLEALKAYSAPVYVHVFLDGRDTPPQSALSSLVRLQNWFKANPIGQIASVCGRFYAMDRDKRYERTQKAYDMLTEPHSGFQATSAIEALEAAYARDETDEFVQPTQILSEKSGKPITIQKGDTVFFVNFRSDRTRQLSDALVNPEFKNFERKATPLLDSKSYFMTMTQYAENLPAHCVFTPQLMTQGLGEIIQNANLTQLRIAETEKYAHVTFFFNGGQDASYKNEDRILIPSPKVRTYDEKPEMSANELTDALVNAIESQKYDMIICNYANADMVGHTGILDCAIKAIETIDYCLGRILKALEKTDGEAIITADHGNAECMQDPKTQEPHTAHTTNLVPFVYVGKRPIAFKSLSHPTLADIAPTILDLMGLPIPSEMTGESLVKK